MEHLGVELHGPEGQLLAGVRGELHVGRRRYGAAVGWNCRDGVAVAHPYLRVFLEALEQRVLGVELRKVGAPVLAGVRLFHLSAALGGYELCPVTYSEDGELAYKLAQVDLKRLRVVNGVRRTAEDYADDTLRILRKLVVRQDFADRVKLTHTAAYELRGL